MRLTFSLSAALLSLAAVVTASNVVDLTPDNFDDHVGGSKGALVEFFAPWCGHCKSLAPTWEQLADAFPSDKVVIAKTDADGVGRPLGERFEVQGFPTLKWFPAGSDTPEDYQGGRDLDSLAKFVTDKSGVRSKIKAPPPPAAVELDSSNFDSIVDGSKNVLVAFTAPWCGHCKNMKAAYEKVARAFEREPEVVVAQMNADADENKALASKFGVRSFPTIKFFPKGSADEPIAYESGRTEDQFTEFLNLHGKTHRTVAGLLDSTAGLLEEGSAWVSSYLSDIPSRAELFEQAKTYAKSAAKDAKSSADYYVRAMERIQEKGDEWLNKEINRLSNILSSSSMAPAKLDDLQKKVNILNAFRTGKKTDSDAEASDKVKDEL